MKKIEAADIAALDTNTVTLLDIRSKEEYELNGFSGSVNVPFDEISTGLSKLPKEKPVYVLCRTGALSSEVTEILEDRGYNVYNIEGGYAAYTVHRAIENG
ncbi:rhodanese-like domain-containing protein [uncultured Ruminococcus sp.]|uniref:rhodanese-like domain-containing protein n=1 Tax=uncultured Ruminococcus sp. TaxID=165186 RepID=UPI002620F24C|nr:rhodanese-like domain-containing protein [uncultured Ruminococcus sp.]